MKLKPIYIFDECDDTDSLFEKLEELQHDGKISYKKSDGWEFKIEDLELTEDEEWDLVEFFEEMDVYPSDSEDFDDEDSDWNEEEEW
jgi:hypothetical protein